VKCLQLPTVDSSPTTGSHSFSKETPQLLSDYVPDYVRIAYCIYPLLYQNSPYVLGNEVGIYISTTSDAAAVSLIFSLCLITHLCL